MKGFFVSYVALWGIFTGVCWSVGD